jgi:hypothetical protein
MIFKYQLILFLLIINITGLSFQDGPMKKIVEKEGLGIYFLFYSEGNGVEHNGVVIFLKNANPYAIDYSFTLIFRADTTHREQEVKGTLKALERKTGSNEGLYFIPFADKRSISEVGVTMLRVAESAGQLKQK